MRISVKQFVASAMLCGWFCLAGTNVSVAQEELDSPLNESPFADDTPPLNDNAQPPVENSPPLRAMPERDDDTRRGVKCPTPEELQIWFKPLDRIQLSTRAADGAMPIDCSTNLFYSPTSGASQAAPARNWAMTEFHWQASNLCAQPAYWDDVPLERYGQTFHPALQPGISGARFFCTFPIIPYKIGIDRTHDLIYTLGYYRPGSPTPQVRQTLPWELDAAAFESGAWIGLVLLLP